MSNVFEFYLPTIRCESCTSIILHKLTSEDFANETGIVIESHQIDRFKKEIKLKIKNSNKKKVEIKNILSQAIEDTGFTCIDITPETSRPPAPFYKRLLTSNWFLGALGTGSGIALLILSMIFSGGLSLVAMTGIGAVSTVLTLALGAPFYYQAVNKFLRTRSLTMDTLFTVSTLTVLVVSLAAFAFPWLPMMFEAGLLIFGFRYLGLAIEETITQKIVLEKMFKDRLPQEVSVIEDDESLAQRKLITIQPDERLLLSAGDIVPVDGECLSESILYDTIITGSVLPRTIKVGERLLAGMRLAEDAPAMTVKANAINLSLQEGDTIPVDGLCEGDDCFIKDEELQQPKNIKKGELLLKGMQLTSPAKLKVTAVANYSYLHRLDRNNEQAQFEKAPIEETTTQVLQYFIPTVIGLAILSGIIIGLFFPPALALQCAVSVLVAACPCTLGLITPLAVKIGINKAAENGVQFKSAKALQAAENVDTIVFDVHGTVTTGIPVVTAFAYNPKLTDEKSMFSYFAAMERQSRHPIAKAIVDYVTKKEIDELSVSQLDEKNHSGLKAKVSKKPCELDNELPEPTEELILGNQIMMQDNGIDVSSIQNSLELQGGQSVVYLARDKQVLGYMVLTDPLRKDAKETIELIKKNKQIKRIFFCTGADKETAERVAKLLDIPVSNIAWGCVGISENPEDNSKVAFIEKLKTQGFNVAMVGDAANDSAALAGTFGIAIKSNSGDEVAQQQASAVVQGDSLQPVANIFTIANQTVSHIKQNLGFSLVYNMTSMVLAGGLLVALGLTLNPAVGVALMILQTSLILLNAYRFKSQDIEHLQPVKTYENSEYQESYGCFRKFINSKKPEINPTKALEEDNGFAAPLFSPKLISGSHLESNYLGFVVNGLS